MDNKQAQKMIEMLHDVSTALVELVTNMQQDIESGNEAKSKDNAQLISNTSNNLEISKEIAENIKSINKDTAATANNTGEILSIVKGLKQQKSTGLFSKIGKDDNKKGMLDGIKSVVLIAGAVLAIGMAFNLIGSVDFMSVIALGIALPFIAKSFATISEMKSLNWKTVGFVAASLPIMAFGLVMAAGVLTWMPNIGLSAGFSALMTAGIMYIASIGFNKVIDSIAGQSWKNILFASIAMPIMAGGIVLSAMVLRLMPTDISLMQGMVGILVGAVMAVAAYGTGIFIKNIRKASLAQIGIGMAAMPIMAAGLVLSAIALQFMPTDIPPVLPALATALILAGASIAMAPVLIMISKLNLSPKDMVVGVLGIVGIAGALAASSHLISMGNYSGGPGLKWSLLVAGLMLAMTPVVSVLGLVSTVNPLTVPLGVLGIGLIAAGIAGISHIISAGTYKGGPSAAWAGGFGLAMLAMVPSAIVLGVPGMQIIAGLGVLSMIILAKGLVEIADIVRKGIFTGGPSVQWAMGMGLAITSFGKALSSVSPGFIDRLFGESTDDRIESLVGVAKALVRIADVVRDAKFTGGPSPEWASGVSGSVLNMARAIAYLDDEVDIDDIPDWLDAIMLIAGKMPDIAAAMVSGGKSNFLQASKSINSMATSFLNLAKSISTLNTEIAKLDKDKANSMAPIAAGMLTIGIIDANKLNSALDVMEKRRAAVRNMFSDIENGKAQDSVNSPGPFGIIKSWFGSGNAQKPVNASPNVQQGGKVQTTTPQPVKVDTTGIETRLDTIISSSKSLESLLDKLIKLTREAQEKKNPIGV